MVMQDAKIARPLTTLGANLPMNLMGNNTIRKLVSIVDGKQFPLKKLKELKDVNIRIK